MAKLNWNNLTHYLNKLDHRSRVYFALFCAKQVIHLADIPETNKCIEVAEAYLDGRATKEECRAVANDAHGVYTAAYSNLTGTYAYVAAAHAAHTVYAAHAAAHAAANAAAHAVRAAAAVYADRAAHAVRAAALKQAQIDYLEELLEFNEIVEREVLGG